MLGNEIIKLENVTKQYNIIEKREGIKGNIIDFFSPIKRSIVAINDISFSILRGEIVGYIGENGAGKSTTIKLLCGILKSDKGSIVVNGKKVSELRKDDYKYIGVMFGQKSQLWWDLATIESFKLLADIYDVKETDFQERLNVIIEYLGIDNLLYTPVRKLSLGQRVLCDFAALYIYKPTLIILDEATIGIDVSIKKRIRTFIKHMNAEGITFFLTTHDLYEIEELCSRILIINKGHVVFDGNINALKEKSDSLGELKIDFKDDVLKKEIEDCICTENVRVEKNSERTYTLFFDKNHIKSNTLISIITRRFEIIDLRLLDASIDRIVQAIYEGNNQI